MVLGTVHIYLSFPGHLPLACTSTLSVPHPDISCTDWVSWFSPFQIPFPFSLQIHCVNSSEQYLVDRKFIYKKVSSSQVQFIHLPLSVKPQNNDPDKAVGLPKYNTTDQTMAHTTYQQNNPCPGSSWPYKIFVMYLLYGIHHFKHCKQINKQRSRNDLRALVKLTLYW